MNDDAYQLMSPRGHRPARMHFLSYCNARQGLPVRDDSIMG